MEKFLKVTDRIILVLASILFIILALCLSILPIAKSKSYYNKEHIKNNVEQILEEQSFNGVTHTHSNGKTYHHVKYDITMDDIKNATSHIIDYLYHSNVESMQFELDTNEGRVNFFSEQAIIHMADVKVLFIGGIRICFISLILFIASVIYIVFRWNHLKQYVMKTYLTVVLVVGIIAIGIIIYAINDFEGFFETFHYIVFPDGDKVELALSFSACDTLTNVLTFEFFIHIITIIICTFVLVMTLSIALCIIFNKFGSKIISKFKKEKINI